MDFGAEYGNYAADLTRTIPVSGRFSARQADVYKAVLRVMNTAKELLKPGVLIDEYLKQVGKIMETELLGLNLITQDDIDKQNPDWPDRKSVV